MTVDPRTAVPLGQQTIRTQIIENIKGILAVAPFDAHADVSGGLGTYDLLFDFVMSGTLDDISRHQTPGCAVEEGDEEVLQLMWPLTHKKLKLFFNTKIISQVGLDQTDLINYYHGRIVNLFVTLPHLANLTTSISEAGNSIQSNGINDPEPGGTLWLEIEYRHAHDDWTQGS